MKAPDPRFASALAAAALAAAIALGCHQSRPVPMEPLRTDSAAVVARARRETDLFVWHWRYLWESSEALDKAIDLTRVPDSMRKKHAVLPLVFTKADSLSIAGRYDARVVPDFLRHQLVHCHPDGSHRSTAPPPTTRAGVVAQAAGAAISAARTAIGGAEYLRIDEYLIPATGLHAVCPSWVLGDGHPPWDERNGIDAGLVPLARDSARSLRSRLLAALDSVARLVPGDAWLTGQRLRFALDQADTGRAAKIAAECRAVRWWCSALSGYIGAVRRQPVPAVDSLFAAAITQMPPEVRCTWTDLTFLLDDDGRRAYGYIACADRDPVNERIWWLSDPLYSEPANDRRVEHYARQVLIALRGGTDWNERWDMHDDGGGRAVREMITRYGWPSFSEWGGARDDNGHNQYLHNTEEEADHVRFSTAEYSAPRFHTVPAWSAVQDPWSTLGYEWVVSRHADEYVNPADTLWWPSEHYDRAAGPMVQLWHQDGIFRRDTADYFAMGADLVPSRFNDVVGDTLKGSLIFSTGPDSMRAEPRGGITGFGAVFRATVPVRPQLVSLELFGRHPRGVVARDRFGIRPPPPLSKMVPGEIAISEPVLIRPLAPGEVLPNDPDAVLSRMFGSTILRDPKRIALYWESYGVKNGDTVEVGVRLERREAPPSALRRIGFKLGVGQRTDGGITVNWREPDPGRIVASIPGRVPIQGRSVSLDISTVAAGDYSLIVTIARPGSTPVTASRDFWISR